MKIIYLIQSDTGSINYSIPKGSEVLLLQWQKDFQETDSIKSFHMPNSSWASGRNELYSRCFDMEYDYYIFLDDDLILDFDLIDFERILIKYKPHRCVPFYYKWPHYKPIQKNDTNLYYTKYIDHCFMAISNYATKKTMPYVTDFDSTNWFKCGELFCEKYSLLFDNKTLLIPYLKIENPKHRVYPKKHNEIKIPANQLIQKYNCSK